MAEVVLAINPAVDVAPTDVAPTDVAPTDVASARNSMANPMEVGQSLHPPKHLFGWAAPSAYWRAQVIFV